MEIKITNKRTNEEIEFKEEMFLGREAKKGLTNIKISRKQVELKREGEKLFISSGARLFPWKLPEIVIFAKKIK